MPVNQRRRVTSPPSVSTTVFDRFDGGWNIRDAISGLELNESPDMKNVVPDAGGGAGARLGISRAHTTAEAGDMTQGFYWAEQNLIVVQVGTQLRKAAPGSNFANMGAAFSTADRVAMCAFNDVLVIVHPVDGVFTSDGTTNTSRNANVKGGCIAAWQNKCWVGSHLNAIVWWSNAGDPTTWTHGTDFNRLNEINDDAIVAIGVGQGMDVVGRPGLLVWKRGSCYRINSSSTGSYTTMSSEAGAAGANAVADIAGLTAFIGDTGIYITNGDEPPVHVSDKIHPLFDPSMLSLSDSDLALWSAGQYQGDRFVFNVKRVAASDPDFTLELHPTRKWIVPHVGCAMRWLINVPTATGSTLWGGGITTDRVYKVFDGGDDDGEPIDSYWTSKALEPNQDGLWHLVRVRAKGRGADVFLSAIENWAASSGDAYQLTDWEADVGTWGVGTWGAPDAFGTGFWGADAYELLHDVWNLGTANAFALRVLCSSDQDTTKPPLFGYGQGQPLGAWNIYGLRLDITPLGIA